MLKRLVRRSPKRHHDADSTATSWSSSNPPKAEPSTMTDATVTQAKATYKRLGKSGLQVSVPILGGMSYGSPKWLPWVLEEKESLEMLTAAYELGINTIDTANVYSNGESERIVGKWIKANNIPRKNLVIMSKCQALVGKAISDFAWLDPTASQQRDYANQGGLSRAAIFNQVEDSLERLQTPYLDVLIIHRFDYDTPMEEIMRALHDLVIQGKVRYLGASAMYAWQFVTMNEIAGRNGWTKFVAMQSEYSLIYREEEREMHRYCNAAGIGIIPYAPLATGVLSRPQTESSLRTDIVKNTPFEQKLTAGDKEILARVEALAKQKGCKMSQIALAWNMAKVTSPLIGATKLPQLQDALIGDRITLTSEEMTHLEEPYETKPLRGFF